MDTAGLDVGRDIRLWPLGLVPRGPPRRSPLEEPRGTRPLPDILIVGVLLVTDEGAAVLLVAIGPRVRESDVSIALLIRAVVPPCPPR